MNHILRIPLTASENFFSSHKDNGFSKSLLLQNRMICAVTSIAIILFVVIAAIYRSGFPRGGFSSKSISFKRSTSADFPIPTTAELNNYPSKFFIHLQGKVNNPSQYEAELKRFEEVMEKYSTEDAFISTCLEEMNLFLTRQFFVSDKALCLEREKKFDLNIFHLFFTISEKFFDAIEKQLQLANNLKIKLANLPLNPQFKRSDFPKISLSQRNQLEILISHFQSEQENYLKTFIDLISKQQINSIDIKKFIKLTSIGIDQLMSDERVFELRREIVSQIPQISSCWNKKDALHDELNKVILRESSPTQGMEMIEKLYRASRALTFFKNQINLRDEQIQIPRWYHATNHYNKIIDRGKIEVREKSNLQGAWVSNRPEPKFGSSVLAFNDRITHLDNDNDFIGFDSLWTFEFGQRWRGIQVNIPLVDQTKKISNLSCVALYKGAKKTEKLAIVQKLKNQNIDPVLFSIAQLVYMQKEIIKTLGNPYLSDQWTSGMDVDKLGLVKPNRIKNRNIKNAIH